MNGHWALLPASARSSNPVTLRGTGTTVPTSLAHALRPAFPVFDSLCLYCFHACMLSRVAQVRLASLSSRFKTAKRRKSPKTVKAMQGDPYPAWSDRRSFVREWNIGLRRIANDWVGGRCGILLSFHTCCFTSSIGLAAFNFHVGAREVASPRLPPNVSCFCARCCSRLCPAWPRPTRTALTCLMFLACCRLFEPQS